MGKLKTYSSIINPDTYSYICGCILVFIHLYRDPVRAGMNDYLMANALITTPPPLFYMGHSNVQGGQNIWLGAKFKFSQNLFTMATNLSLALWVITLTRQNWLNG